MTAADAPGKTARPSPEPFVQLSVITAAIVAMLVGIAGALAIVLAATEAVGATPAETASWVTALLIAMSLTSGILSWRYRIPVITAWSTPGAAVIAATGGAIGLKAAAGAFVLAGVLIVLTALIRPLGRLIERIPMAIASGMLAGVLVRFVVAMFDSAASAPPLVLPLLALYLAMRLLAPSAAMLIVIAAGAALAAWLGLVEALPPVELSRLVLVEPSADPSVLIGLGLPLYIVTMASQNLPGAAVLRAAGYTVPLSSTLAVTGLASILIAFAGAHTVNLAAITAAICAGPDAHRDPAKRWLTGIAYAVVYLVPAAFGAALVAVFAAFPAALIKTIAGLGLVGSLTGALGAALGEERQRFAAVVTFAISASGMSLLGIGPAFWGLVGGLAVHGLDRLASALRA